MSSLVVTDAKVFLAQYDLSGFTNNVKLDYAAKALNDTRMGHTTEVNKGGVKSVAFSLGGFADPGSAGMEAIATARIGTSNLALTTSPTGGAGDVAYFFLALKSSMQTFGQHGELMPYGGTASASGGPLVRGKLFLPASDSYRTGIDSSGIIQLGAVPAGKRVYCALHVLGVSGTSPTLDITIRSAPVIGFSGSSERIQMTQALGLTHEIKSLAGAVTDTYWRADYTIGGSDTPSFNIVVALGIV
jgi:hypothetical protein